MASTPDYRQRRNLTYIKAVCRTMAHTFPLALLCIRSGSKGNTVEANICGIASMRTLHPVGTRLRGKRQRVPAVSPHAVQRGRTGRRAVIDRAAPGLHRPATRPFREGGSRGSVSARQLDHGASPQKLSTKRMGRRRGKAVSDGMCFFWRKGPRTAAHKSVRVMSWRTRGVGRPGDPEPGRSGSALPLLPVSETPRAIYARHPRHRKKQPATAPAPGDGPTRSKAYRPRGIHPAVLCETALPIIRPCMNRSAGHNVRLS